MKPILYPDSGGVCQQCGRRTEKNYLMPVMFHPGRVKRKTQIPMMMCVECIAKAHPGIPQGVNYGKVQAGR